MFPSKSLKPLKWIPGLGWHQLRWYPAKYSASWQPFLISNVGGTGTPAPTARSLWVKGPELSGGRSPGGPRRVPQASLASAYLGRLQVPRFSPDC